MNNQWSKEDLKIYILIYCANADFSENKLELDFIKSRVQESDFEKLHAEFEKDNDFQSIQKIQNSMNEHGYTKEETDSLVDEIKALFMSDDSFNILEQNLFRGLRSILK